MLQDPVMAFDSDLRIAAVNRATERLFDYSAAELIGNDTTVLRPIDGDLRRRRNLEIRRRGFIEGRTQALSGAGDLVTVDLRAAAIGMMASDGIEYLAVMRDVWPTTTGSRLDEVYTLAETAEMLRTSTRTVRRLLAAGTLDGYKLGVRGGSRHASWSA